MLGYICLLGAIGSDPDVGLGDCRTEGEVSRNRRGILASALGRAWYDLAKLQTKERECHEKATGLDGCSRGAF